MTSKPTIATGSVVLAGVAASLVAAAQAPVTATAPIPAPGAWADVLAVGLVIAFLTWIGGVLLAWRGSIAVPAAIAVAVAIQALPLLGPVMFSADFAAYEQYGRVAAEGANPYVDDVSPFPRLVYGPLFALLLEGGTHLGAGETSYRIVASLAWIATTLLVYRITRRASAVVLVGWSPQAALDFAGAGHNDALLVLLMVAALAVGPRAGGALWATAAAVKWIPLVLVPHRLVRSDRRAWAVGFVAALALLAAAATVRYGTGWLASTPIANQVDSPTRNSLPHVVAVLTGIPQRAATLLVGLAFVAVYLAILRRSLRDGRSRMALTLVAFIVSLPWLMGWYLAWILPLAAIEDDRRATAGAFAIGAFFLAWGQFLS